MEAKPLHLWKAQRSIRTDRVLITLPFYILFLAQLAHHVLWRDEINAWTISAISGSLGELFHRIGYEAHPAFWYLLLYAASHVVHAPWMLKVVEGVIGTGIYAALALLSPFRRLELLLILAGYYLAFEYTVFCRMYSLALLFALLYAWTRSRWPDRVALNTLWLALIANVDITAAMLAGALLLEYLLARMTSAQRSAKTKAREAASALGVLFAGIGVSVFSLWPSKDIGWSITGKPFTDFGDSARLVQAALRWITEPWLPDPINNVDQFAVLDNVHLYMAPLLLLALYVVFRPHWREGTMLAALVVTGTLFSHIAAVAGVRHTGMVYIAFLAALWFLRVRAAQASVLAYVLLGIVAIMGGIAISDQWSYPYADSEAAAQWIRANHLQDLPLFGTPDTNVLGVPERLQRPYYQPECNCWDRVLTFSRRRDDFVRGRDEAARLIRGFQTQGVRDGLLLLNRKLNSWEIRQLRAGGLDPVPLATFNQGMLGDEYIFIYRVKAGLAPAQGNTGTNVVTPNP